MTGLSFAEVIERLQVERVVGAAAKVWDDVRPVAGAEAARRPVDRVMTPVKEMEAKDATAAITARHPAQLHARVRCHDNAQQWRSRGSWPQQSTFANFSFALTDKLNLHREP